MGCKFVSLEMYCTRLNDCEKMPNGQENEEPITETGHALFSTHLVNTSSYLVSVE